MTKTCNRLGHEKLLTTTMIKYNIKIKYPGDNQRVDYKTKFVQKNGLISPEKYHCFLAKEGI